MRRRALRFLLASGYCMLLTILLLYQAGAFGGRRDWAVASLGTLFLGAALAVVLVLYMRVNDQIRREGGTIGKDSREGVEAGGRENAGKADGTGGAENVAEARSYEEIWQNFLRACEGRGLSERELEVAWLLYKGRTNRQIGEELFIAETTVKKHVSHIYEKTGVYSRKDFRAMVQTDLLW
ncbi:MAG: LuxR C-terminal-related transcriptional regulator [Bacteroidales bacterium]|nr:LuxR C-terminal-related transcriptional regulator [Bacteroidales bacterium]MCM1415015.1 LuxR C-terminal-related transcriptional regulator [bacterium]MCM1422869.1 LuxR C-terminal-related transcriptional regulator [bacterium]